MARPRQFDEADVLHAARTQFQRTGYAGTSMNDLQEATGLHNGSLYAAFGSKHDLLVHCLEDYCQDLAATARDHLAGSDQTPVRRLQAFVREAARTAAAENYLGCLAGRAASELAGTDDQVGTRIQSSFTELRALLLSCLQAGQRSGKLSAAADPEQLASMLLAVLRGIDAMAVAGCPASFLLEAADAACAALPLA
ncbi:AcrR family transcriptional regulator [Kineococcus radiotolerans]|uniref:AcrR family transcriptional regulator n=1 Tax=Kineococcus radiotolerans TaxID=131568 RepID=A0A7W4TQU6_KINRA|nr:TetR/AcrR family transcriptional regulator [Kineococcus radiotolerans]MBB2903367.1 AcrR family transcriptional regulator [Kineococcus radiotolerans]